MNFYENDSKDYIEMLKNILREELNDLSIEQLVDELDFCTQQFEKIREECETDYDFKSKFNYIKEKIKIIKILIQERS